MLVPTDFILTPAYANAPEHVKTISSVVCSEYVQVYVHLVAIVGNNMVTLNDLYVYILLYPISGCM